MALKKENYVEATYLTILCDERDNKKLAEELGVGYATVYKWLKEGKCPKTVELACKALGEKDTIFLVVTPPQKADAIHNVLDVLNIKTLKIQ